MKRVIYILLIALSGSVSAQMPEYYKPNGYFDGSAYCHIIYKNDIAFRVYDNVMESMSFLDDHVNKPYSMSNHVTYYYRE